VIAARPLIGPHPVVAQLAVRAIDAPGPGGARHAYEWAGPEGLLGGLVFQNGPIKEAGINGVTESALLGIVLDRLKAFQAGTAPCRENALAITKIEEGLMWIHQRTLDRLRRAVEGTNAA
jgi:hypothetical protein